MNIKTLEFEQLDSLRREIRDQNPDIWEPACQRLGEMAASKQLAYTCLCDMLLSPTAEIRLRGLVALRTLAPIRPTEVLGFLRARVDESRSYYDPVLLDAIFFVYAALPNELGKPEVEKYLTDSSEVVRAAAAASLPFWKGWTHGTLVNLAQDSATVVQAGLLSALKHLEESYDKAEALQLLKELNEPSLHALLADFEGSVQVEADPDLWADPMDEEELDELLEMSDPAPVDVSRLELALDAPETAMRFFRRSLGTSNGAFVLEQLSGLCREPALATLLRAWLKMIEGPKDESPSEWLLTILGTLEEQPQSEFLHPLREFLRGCAQAAECENSRAFLTWCCTYQVTTTTLTVWNPEHLEGASLAPEAFDWLGHLARVGAEFEALTLFQLSRLLTELGHFRSRLKQQCPRPECDVLVTVLELWEKMLKEESELLMSGGENA